MPKSIISAVLLISIFGLAIFLVYPKYQRYNSLLQDVKKEETNLQYKESYVMSLNEAKQELEKYNEEFAKIDSALPNDPLVPSMLAYLQKATSQNGLVAKNLGGFSTNIQPENPIIQETHYDFSASGPYSSFKNFLLTLEKSARLIEIEALSLTAEAPAKGEAGTQPVSTESDPRISISFKIKAYSY